MGVSVTTGVGRRSPAAVERQEKGVVACGHRPASAGTIVKLTLR